MPANMRWFADALHQQIGCTVYGPRLAGHGTRPEDMRGVRWQEWYADVLAGYCMLRERCDQVFVSGLSMGADLCLLLAANQSPDGVIAMSTPFKIYDWRVPFIPLIKLVLPYRTKKDTDDTRQFYAYVEEQGRKRGGSMAHYEAYPRYPTSSLKELNDLIDTMRASLPRIKAPVLLIHSQRDDVVPFEQFGRMVESIPCEDKQTLVLEKSLLVVTLDVERITVFESATQFIAAHTRTAVK